MGDVFLSTGIKVLFLIMLVDAVALWAQHYAKRMAAIQQKPFAREAWVWLGRTCLIAGFGFVVYCMLGMGYEAVQTSKELWSDLQFFWTAGKQWTVVILLTITIGFILVVLYSFKRMSPTYDRWLTKVLPKRD